MPKDDSDYKVSKADVLRILDECADATWNDRPFLSVVDYATITKFIQKAIKEIEEL